MKPQALYPVLAAAVGFSVAWVVKPTPETTASATEAASGRTDGGNRGRVGSRPDESAGARRPEEVSASDFPLADKADEGPKTRVEAKMNRLAEALGLSFEQRTKLIAAVEKARADASDDVPVLEDFTRRGNELLEALGKFLTPEQMEAFEQIRIRERDNLIEARAQDRITKVITEVDLSPGQREELLARLKLYERTQIQEIPAAATLLLSTSILPTEKTDLTVDGVLALTRMAEQPAHPNDIRAAHLAHLERQRALLEEELRCFDGILTPGQMSQYHAMLEERKEILEKVERNTLDGTRPTGKNAADPRKLYGDPAPDPTMEDPDEDPDAEEEIDPADDRVEDAAGNPIGS